ncbi:nicotinamide mononucleotide transporter [Glutamicibacter sp.]|uniref:nicotinamide mononucleotide transporter n=1 Tax=Glutamicibacter sp. TaxID=1931995 RepID=UPI0028BF3066|nr:nicotinamide mononucleotide transporter [Glutamicibacter sp.]
MEQILDSLFQLNLSTDSGVQIVLYAVSALFVVIAAFLLAHRNDLGWWALIMAVFAGPIINAMKYDLFALFYGIPLLIIAIFGLWRFSRFELKGKFVRNVTLSPLTLTAVIGFIAGVILLVALRFNVFLISGTYLSATKEIWVMYFAEAVLFASFVLIARGVRAGWLLLAVGAIANVVVYFVMNPVLGMLGLQVFTAIAALYGFFLWRNLPAAKDEVIELTDEEKALDAAAKATLDKLNAKTENN